MAEFTVAYAAAIIAAAFFLARQFSPNAITYTLSQRLGQVNTAATWTTASSVLQQSYWPFLLRSDNSYSNGVRKDVLWVSRLLPAVNLLMALAGVITPLGLYQEIAPSGTSTATFVYASDSSIFKLGTQASANATSTRICGWIPLPKPCPFSDRGTVIANGTEGLTFNYPHGYNATVPQGIVDLFSSGVASSETVSSYFDIRWRTTIAMQDVHINNNTNFRVGAYRHLRSLALNNRLEVVEGLIVDTVSGGIGFRNHTVPTGFPHGVKWEEDILFMTPETACVDTNLTLDFTVLNGNGSSVSHAVLTDRGGFVDAVPDYTVIDYQNSQKDPDLYTRAYLAAHLHNYLTALVFNVTNVGNRTVHGWSLYNKSARNKTYSLDTGDALYDGSNTKAFSISPNFINYLQNLDVFGNKTDSGFKTNIYGITSTNYSYIHDSCSGVYSLNPANATNILVGCGLMRSIPQKQGGGDPWTFEKGSQWSQKLYTCASAVSASVKTVSFQYIQTGDHLSTLTVSAVREKDYDNKTGPPIWGVQDTGLQYRVDDINPLWGIVSSRYQGVANLTTFAQPRLYVPGWVDPYGSTGFDPDGNTLFSRQDLAGSDIGAAALSSTYISQGSTNNFDYSGQSDLPMWVRWRDLSSSPHTASLIPNLIWTDISASAVTGTKGITGGRPGSVSPRVTPFRIRVRYHYAYIAPAAIVALLLLVIVCGTLVAVLRAGRGSLAAFRRQLQQLSPGRMYTVLLVPGREGGDLQMRGKDWNKSFGAYTIDLSGERPSIGAGASGKDDNGNGNSDGGHDQGVNDTRDGVGNGQDGGDNSSANV